MCDMEGKKEPSSPSAQSPWSTIPSRLYNYCHGREREDGKCGRSSSWERLSLQPSLEPTITQKRHNHTVRLSPRRTTLGEPFDILKIEPHSAKLLGKDDASCLMPVLELATLCPDPRPSSSLLHKDSYSPRQVKENDSYLL